MNRRQFIAASGAVYAQATLAHPLALAAASEKPADHHLSIEPCTIEIGPNIFVKTVAYDGKVPGPTLHLRHGVPVSIDVTNRTAVPEIAHWHGLTTDVLNDGAMEEGSPMIAPGTTLRYHLTPGVSGTRWYHTHASAYGDLARSTYTGQFGFLLIDEPNQQHAADRTVELAIHHWEPSVVPMVEMLRQHSTNHPQTSGSDVGYKYATINGHMLGAGEPLRVKCGERILLRLLNASATGNTVFALPGHSFKVIAMDGNPVPRPQTVSTISLAVAERIDAIVEMNSPGVWVLGSTLEKERAMGLGIIVEYAGSIGNPVWRDPAPETWDYAAFASSGPVAAPDETFELTFRDIGPAKDSRFDVWTINNRSWPDIDPLRVHMGKRYRLVFRNGSGDQHPVHLHRHSFEVARIGDRELSGLMKDVINIMPLDEVAVDFVADNPGDTLLHCHQQLHMDYGFMQLIRYA